ncbi:serine hydrolase [Streptomyces sp. NPDC056161]|uniref:D-alanyl-D-alanine carboxypeptidase n=1 Tax=Streptomyces sp. NPDC056161 TaxID=3345732 RepID=UPI0035D68447
MADRTPDTGVLDQDDPSAGPSSAQRDPSPASTAKDKGRPSGEQTSGPEETSEPKRTSEPEQTSQPERTPGPEQTSGPGPAEETDGPGEPERAKNATDTPAHRADDDGDTPDENTGAAERPASEPEPSEQSDRTGEPERAKSTTDTTATTDAPARQPDNSDDETPVDSTGAPSDDGPGQAGQAEGAEKPEEADGLEEVTGVARVEAPAPPSTEQDAPSPQDTQGTQPAVGTLDPLDPLAHLTDPSSSPSLPARTLRRGLKIWAPLVALLVLVVLVVVQLVRPLPRPVLSLDAGMSSFTVDGTAFAVPWPARGQAAVMVEGSGTIGTFGEQKPVPTASVAKVMTAYVILREHPLSRDEPGPRVTVDAQAVEEGKAKDESRIEGLRVGQTFSLLDMLRMLMIPSGNNVARLLARWDTGTRDETAFVRKMNEAARSLGMKNTTYTDPSGLDEGTVSTAVDQLVLAEAVMRSDAFRAVVAMAGADIPGVGRIYNNNDRLLLAGLSVMGIKTGSNTSAGGALSWAAYKSVGGVDRLILGTMLDQHVTGADPNGANSLVLVQDNSKKVITAVREALTSATVVREGQVVGHVDDRLGGRTAVVATRDLAVAGVPGQQLTLTLRGQGKALVHGAPAGTVVGELAVDGGTGAQRVPVALRSELREPSVGTKLTRTG